MEYKCHHSRSGFASLPPGEVFKVNGLVIEAFNKRIKIGSLFLHKNSLIISYIVSFETIFASEISCYRHC